MRRVLLLSILASVLACSESRDVTPTSPEIEVDPSLAREASSDLAGQIFYELHDFGPTRDIGGRLTAYNAADLSVIAEARLPVLNPYHLVVTQDGRTAYVAGGIGPGYRTGMISKVDLVEMRVTETLSVGGSPYDIWLSPKEDRLLITTFYAEAVTVVDTEPLRFVAEIALPPGTLPNGIISGPDGQTVYVGAQGNDLLHAIDLKSLSIKGSLAMGVGVSRVAFLRNTNSLVAFGASESALFFLNPHTLEVRRDLVVPECPSPTGMVDGPNGRVGVLVCSGAAFLGIVDLKRGEWLGQIDLPTRATRIYEDATGRFAIATHRSGGGATLVDLSTLSVRASVQDGYNARGGAFGSVQPAPVYVPERVHVELIDLGASAVGGHVARDINELGIIVGNGECGAFILDPQDPENPSCFWWADLHGAQFSAINGHSDVAGDYAGDDGRRRVFLLPFNEDPFTVTDGSRNHWVSGINDDAHLVGTSGGLDPFPGPAFYWAPGMNGPHYLAFEGPLNTYAMGINNADQIAGWAPQPVDRESTVGSAAFWASPTDDPVGTGVWGEGYGINEAGLVSGMVPWSGGRSLAMIWRQEKGIEILGALPGVPLNHAFDVNEVGQVVGFSSTWPAPEGQPRDIHKAFFWDRRVGMIELPLLGERGQANAINNDGWVVGWSEGPDGGQRAVLWKVTVQ